MKKKGMFGNYTFTAIIGLITIVFIMLFGFSFLNNLGNRGDDVELTSFENKLSLFVNKIRSTRGVSDSILIAPPSGYDEVCIIDSAIETTTDATIEYPIPEALYDPDQTVYFLKKGIVKDSLSIEGISIDVPYSICFNEEINLKFENQDKEALLMYPNKETCADAEGSTEIFANCNSLNTNYYSGYSNDCCTYYDFCCQ